MRRIAGYATNEIIPSGAKRQVRNWEVVSYTLLNIILSLKRQIDESPSIERC